jgi:hypothetical protein
MRLRTFVGSLFLLLVGNVPTSFAAGCGDMTLCVKNPPFPPDPPSCTQYPNYCSYVPPQVQTAAPAETPSGGGYSIALDNLSKDQLDKVLGQLGVDTGKVKGPP